ncbi:hypothetical protein [Fodinibius halophilus]|uniref:Uncharacterized protein n=1 Tax=Fodinibius halophilus TaxID=1736908 RepID=A0A6M1TJW5_9BACT|nr:hypothetical protein [Fodinibius halophilus]NGP88890.1 hypothetical protein [Fodinibius halophilus]
MNKEQTERIRVGLSLFSLFFVLSITGCDFSGFNKAVDDFAVVVELESINTNSTVLLTDAQTGELITKEVTATFGGDNGEDVIDMYSDPISEKKVNSGVLNFGIANSVSPSESSPVKVKLKLEAEDYETTTRTVSINSEGDSKFSLNMLDPSNQPKGVKVKTAAKGQASSDGTVQGDFEVSVNSDENPGSGVSFQVSSGTVLKDKGGNNLSGQLTTDISYYDPDEADALDTFPGDLITKNDEPISSAGIFSLQLRDESGNIATSTSSNAKSVSGNSAISSGATVTLTLPSGYIDPMTGRVIKDGDTLTIFVLGVNGNFTTLAQKQVITNNAGELAIKVPAFADNAQAFVVGTPLIGGTTCSGNISFNRNGYNGSITGRVYTTGLSAAVNLGSGNGSSSYTIPTIPDQDFNYVLTTTYGELMGSHNFCSGGDLDITLNPPASLIDATVDVSLKCKNSNEAVRITDIPGASVLYRKENAAPGTNWSQASNLQWDYNKSTQRLTGGSFDISGVEQGKRYVFKTTYKDNDYEKAITISGSTVEYSKTITDGICQ